MDIITAIKGRRSVRKFKSQAPDESTVVKIIEIGSWAPSHCNSQQWKFVIVTDSKVKQEIVNCGGSGIIKDAPVAIFVFYDNRTANTEYADYIQSAAAAIQNMLLGAYSLGLDGCWVCHLPGQKDLRKILGYPIHYSVVACILLGFAQNPPLPVERKNKVQDIISYNVFRFKEKAGTRADVGLTFRRSLIKIYRSLPKIAKKIINPVIEKKFVKRFKN